MAKKDPVPVLYEDDTMLAVNKASLIPSVPDPHTPLAKSILGMVQKKYESQGIKPYLLHRLDAETSGVLLFGKKPSCRPLLEAIFRHPDTHKKYLALLKGVPRGSEITIPLSARMSDERIPAETHFRILMRISLFNHTCTFVEAEIKTGRRHQIRQHFARVGCPVVLDRIYGDDRFNRDFSKTFQFSRLFLHSRSITFFHPFLKEMITIDAPFPPDLFSVTKKLLGKNFII